MFLASLCPSSGEQDCLRLNVVFACNTRKKIVRCCVVEVAQTCIHLPLETCTPPSGKLSTLPLTTLFVKPTNTHTHTHTHIHTHTHTHTTPRPPPANPSPQPNTPQKIISIPAIPQATLTCTHYILLWSQLKTATTLHLTILFPVLQANTTCSLKQSCSPDDGHNDARNINHE
jgi:hypothetical protein